MRYLAGYIGCTGIFLLLMGLVFHAFILPTIRPRKKPFLEWFMIAAFGFGMYNSMATKPGSDAPAPSPRRSPPQHVPASPSDAGEGTAKTNTPPWECGLAFCKIEKSPTNVLLTAAWPFSLFDYAPTFDLFIAKPQLTNDWQWFASQTAASSDTNCTFTVTAAQLGLAELPPALFARVTERNEACKTMDDPDGDGVPNPYELYHGTNPYIPDAHRIQTLDCTNTSLSTLKTVLESSTDYSIINLPTGTIDAAESIVMPPHPVLLSGPQNGYTVIKSTADLGAFMLKDGQDSHTLIRNVYLDLLKRGCFQVGFWCGGNLPWSGIGASPSFENIGIRMPRPETEYIGWLFYGDNGETVSLSNCFVNAMGATWVRGVESGNGPAVAVKDFTCLNTPTNFIPTLSRTFTRGNNGQTNTIVRQGAEATVFVDLTPGVDSDGDGLTNIRELEEHHTDPWLSDTDGDGIPDPDELISGTDPLDVLSFIHGVVIEVTNTTAVAGSQVYVSWERVGDFPESGFLTNSAARSFFTSFSIPHTNGEIRITCFRDLNGNTTFDPDHDISLTQSIPDRSEYTRLKFTFGDVDHDGINDLQERHDGTNPYSASSLRIKRTVNLKNDDLSPPVTNYVAQGLTRDWNADEPFHRLSGISETLTFDTNAISGSVYLKCYRDFNANGVYDEDLEPLYVYQIQNAATPSDGTISLSFKDKDGDSIPDSLEWSEGTDLNKRRSYCYSANLTVTGIFSTTNQLYAQPFFGTNALANAHAVHTNQEEYAFAHFSTTNSERFVVKYWDDFNNNETLDDGEPYTTATVSPNGHETTLVYDLPYSRFDANNNRLPDWWEITTGLSTNSAPYDYYTDTDNDGLINLHEYWTGCDPLTPDGSNTVLSILARSIDDRLTDDPTGRMNIYNNYYSPSLEPNTNCWAFGIDLSCASPYNTYGGTNRAGTAISSHHIILANHYPIPNGTTNTFVSAAGDKIKRVVIDGKSIPNTDIFICLLDEGLPESFCPAKFLPRNFSDYIGNGLLLPTLMLDQEEHAIVSNLSSLNVEDLSSGCEMPRQESRKQYHESIIGGDSGNPVFLVCENNVILLFCFKSGGEGAGPFTTNHAKEIQNTMDTLSDRKDKPRENLRYFDFTTHTPLQHEYK